MAFYARIFSKKVTILSVLPYIIISVLPTKRSPEVKELTKLEELVMVAIWRLKDEAYGVEIKNKVKEIGGKEYFYNTLYTTFDQLARKRYITKHFGEPSAVRGGKKKVFFHVTKVGRNALRNAFRRNSRIWAGINEESFRREYP